MSSESIGGTGKPKLDIDGLFSLWDGSKAIRDHLAVNGNVLFPENLTESVKTACYDHIHAIVKPLLVKMSRVEGAPQPSVDALRENLAELYRRNSKQVDKQIVHDSWMVRKFLGFVKMKCRVRKPSRAPCFDLII